MAMAVVKLILAGVLVMRTVHAARTHVAQITRMNTSMASGGNSRCIISWTAKGHTSEVSFGVNSCMIGCRVTNFDNHYDKKFAERLSLKQQDLFCSCRKPGGRELLKLGGACGEDEETKKRCFEQYKMLRTNTFAAAISGKTATTIVRHPDDYHERTFIYHGCTSNACPHGCRTKLHLPSISDGMGADEKEIVSSIQRKRLNGQTLAKEEKELIEQFSDDDLDEMLFANLARGRTLTVQTLRDEYNDAFKAHDVDGNHVLASSDLYEDKQKVDLLAFKRFNKMYEKAQTKQLSDEIASEILFTELSPDGGPLSRKVVRQDYEKRLGDTPIEVKHVLTDADLYSDRQMLDLKDFTRFRKTLKKVQGGSGTDGKIFDELSSEKPLTVKELRKIYREKLKGTGIKVDKLLAVADLTNDEQVVDLKSFRKFLAPDCTRKKAKTAKTRA